MLLPKATRLFVAARGSAAKLRTRSRAVTVCCIRQRAKLQQTIFDTSAFWPRSFSTTSDQLVSKSLLDENNQSSEKRLGHWTVDDVVNWAKSSLQLDEHTTQMIQEHKINGAMLLQMPVESFNKWGISAVPAAILANAVTNLVFNQLEKSGAQTTDKLQGKFNELISYAESCVRQVPLPPLYDPNQQQRWLGTFNKPDVMLPFAGGYIDLRLLGFGNHLTSAAQEILKNLNQKHLPYIAVCLGQSGCGKTRTIFDVASKHWVMYIECVPTGEERIDSTRDTNFGKLVADVTDLSILHKNNKSKFYSETTTRILIEILARLLYLRGLFAIEANITPQDYLLGQIDGGQNVILDLVYRLKFANISKEEATFALRILYLDLQSTYFGGKQLVIALDEANVALSKIFPGKFRNNNGSRRGFLTPITNVIVDTPGFRPSVLFAGTALSLGTGAASIQSDIGKKNRMRKIVDFPPSAESEIQEWFAKWIDLSGCEEVWEDPEVRWYELAGRQRLRASVITHIASDEKNNNDDPSMKQQSLTDAIRYSIKLHHGRMKSRLKLACNDRPEIITLLKKVVSVSLLSNGKMYFAPTPEDQDLCDLVNVGICQLVQTQDSDTYAWELAEPLAMRVALEVLEGLGISEQDIILNGATYAMFHIMVQLGPKSSEKGKFAEYLTAAQMFQWSGNTLANLEIVKANINNDKIPQWMHRVTFHLSKFGSARQLGFSDDLKVIEAIKSNKLQNVLLMPENNMGPDGLWLTFQGGQWFAIVLAQKVYSSNVDQSTFNRNNRAANLSLVYIKKQYRVKCNSFHQITDEAFRNDSPKLGGILRIHVLLPSVVASASYEASSVENDGKEVLLYITKNNISSLFPSPTILQVLSTATNTNLI